MNNDQPDSETYGFSLSPDDFFAFCEWLRLAAPKPIRHKDRLGGMDPVYESLRLQQTERIQNVVRELLFLAHTLKYPPTPTPTIAISFDDLFPTEVEETSETTS